MIEAITEDNNLFKIFSMKDLDYVMHRMVIRATLEQLQGTRTRIYFIDRSGTKQTKQFTYWQPFGINFRYRHQVYNHNNHTHAPIYLKKTRATKFWPDRNFAWYLSMSEANKDLVPGHFQNDGVVQPSLYFRIALLIEWLKNTIGF